MGWIIVHQSDEARAWNDTERAWQDGDNYDTFDDTERATMMLPRGGRWLRVPWNKLED